MVLERVSYMFLKGATFSVCVRIALNASGGASTTKASAAQRRDMKARHGSAG